MPAAESPTGWSWPNGPRDRIEHGAAEPCSPSPNAPQDQSHEPPEPGTFGPPDPLAPGSVRRRGPGARGVPLGCLAVAADGRGCRRDDPGRSSAVSRRVRRFAVPQRTPGGRVCRGRCVHRPATGRSPRPMARTPWADRCRRSAQPRRPRRTGAGAGLPFESKGVQYNVEHGEGRLFHQATWRGADGGVLARIEAEVRYALGSGTRGVNFLIEREGALFQSPIAWFAHERRWDISPGYRELSAHANFERRSSLAACSATPTSSAPSPGR